MVIYLLGGGGFEIWQFTKRTPKPASFQIQLGDFGIFATKIKFRDGAATYNLFKANNLDVVGELNRDPSQQHHFFAKNPYGNLFQVVLSDSWFNKGKKL